MPIVKFVNKSYMKKTDMMNLLFYIVERAVYVSGFGISTDLTESVFCEFEYAKRFWNKAEEGRRQVRHLVVIFENPKLSLDSVCEMAWKIAAIYGNRFQVFYGVHMDTGYPHVHFAINTVSFIDGRMYSEGYADLQILKKHISIITHSYEHI